MSSYYLTVDIDASSGRYMPGSLEDGRMHLEEIYRFPNGMKYVDGSLCWDVDALFYEIKKGLKRCREIGKIPSFMGIDTWAVDYVLLDVNVYEEISLKNLYARTGIQKQMFNTIYQLMAVKQKEPELFKKAENMLMIPDYFHFLLMGVKRARLTIWLRQLEGI